jgi:hypothetical protein
MFRNLTSQIIHNQVQLNYGVAVTDIDGDGEFEIFVTGYGFPNVILKWVGAGFVNITDHVLADVYRHAIGVAACDIDGDGQEEIYILNTDTFAGVKRYGDRLFDFVDGKWVDLFSLPENADMRNLIAGRSVAAVDRQGDGRYGFFVANYGAPMRLFEQDAQGTLADVAPQVGLARTTGGRSVLSLPLVSHHMDILAGNENGPNYLFVNQGDGTYKDMALQKGISDPHEHARGLAVLDFNQDGLFDIICGNWEGPHRLFQQNDADQFTEVAPSDMAAPSRVRTVIAADFDNDGYEEIFFNNITQPNRLFAWRDGAWTSIPLGDAEEPHGLGTGAVIGDFNQDGVLELLIAHGESGLQPLTLYSSPTKHNWLRVLPLTAYGAPARGALVTLVTAKRTQRRVIDAGSGYLCQMEPVAHFGLGDQTEIERIIVRWPGGEIAVLENPAINTLHRIPHPNTQ